MIIGLSNTAFEYKGTIQDIIWLFYPGAELVAEDKGDFLLQLNLSQEVEFNLWAEAQLYVNGASLAQREEGHPLIPAEVPNELKRLARMAVYKILVSYSGTTPSPWGIMTGIRPTKVVHRLLDLGWSKQNVENYLLDKYALRPDKTQLITSVTEIQRPLLLSKKQAKKLVGVYIGIPFCPSRCLYCSFPSYSIKRHRDMVDPFLKALLQEIQVIGETLRSQGLLVQSIYLGGGTPTSLNCEQLQSLLEAIQLSLKDDSTIEMTVEGGRPDTLNEDVFALLANAGVNRLSINPQSMNQKTLDIIGRAHTVEDIYRSVETARNYKFPTLNMDLIIGLPGETVQDVARTMESILQLKPENLTVHALALKRASNLKQRLAEFPLLQAEEAVAMWQETARGATALGQHPYYMYRQKQMVGNLENIGYALPGHECIYNIQMIEERQTIIGLGVGAGSKWMDPDTWTLVNEYNAKDPRQYVERLDEYIERKLHHIRELSTKQ
ncbi:coproporphyrinogen III oxidase, anaerobic [Desulforamulus reducens MI-1]|uniref:Coproporphyrinogen III oxidase, anaerobic n=1 Tax=Desulforamulus reducens (strain ATCC BAA-1160 / DSM 100696 / MI-1) TaxID=349161 RepID=A4J8I2_DESRM|nr:coproporphyrinogen dehydrogenase HemZ [Desulforamulus reducens]ABO51385.1 coproporphyrinogen III oxidase, anaerobic [Desulforamulus reducens MI-1]